MSRASTEDAATARAVAPHRTPNRVTSRFVLAVALGCILAAAAGVLFSYVAFLMAYLGLFFYALFGLLIGAMTWRIAAPGAPYSRGAVTAATTLIVGTSLVVSWAFEIYGLPHDVARQAVEKLRELPEGQTKQQYMAGVEARVRDVLAERYPPGGATGYVRWIMDTGRFDKGTFNGVDTVLSRTQRRYVWLVRVGLSVLLLSFGVAAMTLPLASPRPSAQPKPPDTLYG